MEKMEIINEFLQQEVQEKTTFDETINWMNRITG